VLRRHGRGRRGRRQHGVHRDLQQFLAQADYRGFGHLAAGVRGEEQANCCFAGHPETASKSHIFHGPCGERRLFNINTDLRVITNHTDFSAVAERPSRKESVQ
jgi:hypothetical protein